MYPNFSSVLNFGGPGLVLGASEASAMPVAQAEVVPMEARVELANERRAGGS